MPRASVAVTVSARKKYFLFLALNIAALLLLFSVILRMIDAPQLTVNGRVFAVEVMDTNAKRLQGLSGRTELPASSAMLFKFNDSGQRCFWMKDMTFAVDIVWLNEAKKVVAVERSVHPNTYPKSFCHDGVYVAEFAAGIVKTHGISTGAKLNF